MAWSIADIVGCRRLPAAVASPAVMAVRRRRIRVRTRVRFARLTSARSRDCAARFKTDFFFFLTLVACPWAIYCSFCVSLKLLTLNEAHGFVKRAERSVVSQFAASGTVSVGTPNCASNRGNEDNGQLNGSRYFDEFEPFGRRILYSENSAH